MAKNKDEIYINVDFDRKSEFVGRSVENGLPVTNPIHNFEELLAWQANDSDDAGQAFSVSHVPLQGKTIPKGSPKTLVCHDMAGGYVDDRFVQGVHCKDDKWYYIENWDIIDTFVYFSHHFVTIPPVGWINCAHQNGVAVLGTVITEYDEGYNRWKAILSSNRLWELMADRLVEIAKFYNFEGWLLNIENIIKIEHVPNVIEFVKYLTDKMHQVVPGSQVIWYDSVTKNGDLKWQNELNSENIDFFKNCDGIFLNYGWDEGSLYNSANLARTLSRVQDVYVGIDVFGRGCFGGGGFNSVAALEVIRRFELSAAIFAPGWVKEVLGSKDFEKNQRLFWALLSPLCRIHARSSNDKTILVSNFASGIYSSDEGSSRFLNLSEQSALPCLSNSIMSLHLQARFIDPCLIFSSDNECLMYKTFFAIPSECLMVCMVVEIAPNFSIETDVGNCTLNNTGYSDKEFDVRVTIKSSENGDCYTWSIRSKVGKFTVQSFSRLEYSDENCDSPVNVVGLRSFSMACVDSESSAEGHAQLVNDRMLFDVIKISVKDVTWELSSPQKTIFLSCTLVLENSAKSVLTKISYSCDNSESPKYSNLGNTLSNLYRVNKLEIPNPVFHGPSKLVLVAEQVQYMQCLGPGNSGELVIHYSENMKHYGQGLKKEEFVMLSPIRNEDQSS